MVAYENDTLIIPTEYKKMSVSELEKEKKRVLEEALIAERPKKALKQNKNNIIFHF